MLNLKQSGFTPDVILAHPGWGETLYAKDVFAEARVVHYCEWYYRGEGADVGFDPEFPSTLDDRARVRTWNALHALNLTNCDAAVTPTHWQKRQHPEIFHSKITVQHEGIALHELGPDPAAVIKTPNGAVLEVGDPVITYVARNLEPYRGFHVFMRALERIQRAHATCHAVIIGGDDVSYGKRPKDAPNWREKMLRDVKLDATRTYFMGRVPRETFIRAMQVSAAHVYLTYPFVLSWSLLEAMACGAPIVASDTAPVREVLLESSARLFDFHEVGALSERVLECVGDREGANEMSRQARKVADRFDQGRAQAQYDLLLGARR
jgi:glycosyltransferase involved in cell wall biosynthesis